MSLSGGEGGLILHCCRAIAKVCAADKTFVAEEGWCAFLSPTKNQILFYLLFEINKPWLISHWVLIYEKNFIHGSIRRFSTHQEWFHRKTTKLFLITLRLRRRNPCRIVLFSTFVEFFISLLLSFFSNFTLYEPISVS